MHITVIVCTHNRCRSLGEALESLAASVLPAGVRWEVLVVDNKSSDETREVVEAYIAQYPGRFRYTFEPKAGKSYALNRGIREAQGGVFAFMDDDVIVRPDWLHNLTSSLSEGQWAGAAGRILPEETFQPPRWIPAGDRYALAPLAVFDPACEAGLINDTPFGANMAFQKWVFQKHGNFREDLGPQPGGSPQKSEDSEFGNRLLAAGESLRYEPNAVVYHGVPPHRLQKSYFLAWWFDKARADVVAFGVPRDTRWFVAGVPVYFFRRLLGWTVRWIIAITPSTRFSAKTKVWSLAGSIAECHRQASLRALPKATG